MNLKVFFKGFLVAISYHSIKKVIDGYPQPWRNIIICLFRAAVLFFAFILIFSFFTGLIDSIASNIRLPDLFRNIFVGINFMFSLMISWLFTAVIEQIYRKLSEVKQQAQKSIEAVQETAQVPARAIQSSMRSTKAALVNTGKSIGDSSKKLYDASLKITNTIFDSSLSGIKKVSGKIRWKRSKGPGAV